MATTASPRPSPRLDKTEVTRVDKPWGHELIFARTARYAGKLLCIKKGHRLSKQYHIRKEESFFVHSGRARIELETPDGVARVVILEPGEALHLLPGTRHRTEAIEETIIFEVSTPELDDVVRISDDYGRSEKK